MEEWKAIETPLEIILKLMKLTNEEFTQVEGVLSSRRSLDLEDQLHSGCCSVKALETGCILLALSHFITYKHCDTMLVRLQLDVHSDERRMIAPHSRFMYNRGLGWDSEQMFRHGSDRTAGCQLIRVSDRRNGEYARAPRPRLVPFEEPCSAPPDAGGGAHVLGVKGPEAGCCCSEESGDVIGDSSECLKEG
uniref:Uncharacterized protein n=1 Tax=Physcomitrium patens TaxID=3218 RepID=A0A2K1INS6_PHYPA|nr:hypothetical protein PHYPA_027240 [Physcomitrium patens]